MKIELMHDSLAKYIYARSSAEDKARLRAKQFVQTRYEYYEWKGILLNESELKTVLPYKEVLSLPAEQHKFVEKSQRKVSRQSMQRATRRTFMVVLPSTAVLLLFIGFTEYQKWEYETQEVQLKKEVKSLEKQKEKTQKEVKTIELQRNVVEQKAIEQANYIESNRQTLERRGLKTIPKAKVNIENRGVIELVTEKEYLK